MENFSLDLNFFGLFGNNFHVNRRNQENLSGSHYGKGHSK